MADPSPFSGFNDMHDVTNLGFAPYFARLSYDLARTHESLPFPYFFEQLLGAALRLQLM